jgi:hypothetical protein
MIHSDLYTRLVLLGNGDEVRRCRDAHTEGQTIEESLRVSPSCWSQIQLESGSIDPGFPKARLRERLTAAPFLAPPLFFPSTLTCAQQEQNSTALEAVPPLRCAKLSSDIFPFQRLHFPPSSNCICTFIPVLVRHTPGTSSGTFRTRFPSSKLEAGQGGSS